MAAVRGLVSYGDSSSDEEEDAGGLVAKYSDESPQANAAVAAKLPAAEAPVPQAEVAVAVEEASYDVMPPVSSEPPQQTPFTEDYPIGPPPPPAESHTEAPANDDQDMYGPMPVPAGADDVLPYATVVQEEPETSGAPSAHPLLDRLPAEITAPEDPSSQLFARLSQYIELSRSGHDFTSVLRRRDEWGNPSLLTTIIDELNIDQYGTFYPPALFAPAAFMDCDYFDVLDAAQQHKVDEEKGLAAKKLASNTTSIAEITANRFHSSGWQAPISPRAAGLQRPSAKPSRADGHARKSQWDDR